jgi:hypothetical protein
MGQHQHAVAWAEQPTVTLLLLQVQVVQVVAEVAQDKEVEQEILLQHLHHKEILVVQATIQTECLQVAVAVVQLVLVELVRAIKAEQVAVDLLPTLLGGL